MAKKYLKGSDIEKDNYKCKATLLGLAHQLYVQSCENKGINYLQNNYITLYGARIQQKKEYKGEVDIDGAKKYNYSNEYALEFDEDSESYKNMIDIHKNKTKTSEELQGIGWNLE